MKYIENPGIVRTKICGETVLIPTRAAYDYCKSVQILPKLWAGTYSSICRGAPMEKILKIHRMFMRQKTDEQILTEIEDFCKKLCAKGFLTEVPDPDRCSPDETVSPDLAPSARRTPQPSIPDSGSTDVQSAESVETVPEVQP